MKNTLLLTPAKSLDYQEINPENLVTALNFKKLIFLSIISGFIWVAVASPGSWVTWLGFFTVVSLILYSTILLFQKKFVPSLSLLTYLAIIQPIVRTYVPSFPYLGFEYYFLFWSFIVLITSPNSNQKKTGAVVFYIIYLFLELFGILDVVNLENARSTIISSACVGAALLLLRKYKLEKPELTIIFTSILIGVFSISAVIGYGYITAPNIQWGTESNFASSGGMGPVQISMLMALGVIILLVLLERVPVITKSIYLLLTFIIATAMVLTFSRNGLYLVVISIIIYYIIFTRPSFRFLLLLLVIGLLGYLVYRVSYDAAGDVFIRRFSSTTSARTDLIIHGWKIFLDHPLLGVGTGNYAYVVAGQEYFGSVSGAHNELIRAAAEHGFFGLVTWLLFAFYSLYYGLKDKRSYVRALRITLLVVFFAYSFVNGLKLLSQPIVLFISLSVEDF